MFAYVEVSGVLDSELRYQLLLLIELRPQIHVVAVDLTHDTVP